MTNSDLITPILIADENSSDRSIVAAVLRKVRPLAQIRELHSVAEVRRLILPALPVLPKLVIMDVKTTLDDGMDTLQEIMPNAKLLKVPVVILTSLRTEEIEGQCYRLGVNSVIAKPTDLSGLINIAVTICHDWLDKHNQVTGQA